MICSLDKLTTLFSDTVTVIEPHHDDFCLSVFGSMYYLDSIKHLKKLKIITVFGISPGCSIVPTSVMTRFFTNCQIESKEFLYPNITPGGNAKFRAEYVNEIVSWEDNFTKRSGRDWNDFQNEVISLCEGDVIAPMGFKHPDHNLLSRLPCKYLYREYPYWWHQSESFKKIPSLYNYYDMESVGEIDLEQISDFKSKVFRSVYYDVQGQFNPMFGSARPAYYDIRTEEFFTKLGLKEGQK